MNDISLDIIELEKVYRQKDADFIDILNRIRNNTANETDTPSVYLTTTNAQADDINTQKLSELITPLLCHEAKIKGDFGREYFPTAPQLNYKVGSQIMLLNNDSQGRWVNGTMEGIVDTGTDVNGDAFIAVTLQHTHKTVSVYPYKWEVFTYTMQNGKLISEPLGSFTQYPFRLAWAITIHKSQGKTFDKVTIDLGNRVFTDGQAYVALSRCTTLSGISLTTPIEKKHIRTDPRIYKFLTSYAYKKASEDLSFDDKLDIIGKAIADGTKLHMTYLKANDTKSERVIKPLTLGDESYQGHDFVGMRAYCTIRKENRMFNVNRILNLKQV